MFVTTPYVRIFEQRPWYVTIAHTVLPEARSAAGMSSLPLAPRRAADVLRTSPSIILSPIRVPAAGLMPPRSSTGGRLGPGGQWGCLRLPCSICLANHACTGASYSWSWLEGYPCKM